MDLSSNSLGTVSLTKGAWVLVAKGDIYKRYGQAGAIVTDKNFTTPVLYMFGGSIIPCL